MVIGYMTMGYGLMVKWLWAISLYCYELWVVWLHSYKLWPIWL
jgi:hypothetical protein